MKNRRDKRICSFGRFEKNLGRNNKEKLSDYLYGEDGEDSVR